MFVFCAVSFSVEILVTEKRVFQVKRTSTSVAEPGVLEVLALFKCGMKCFLPHPFKRTSDGILARKVITFLTF